MAGKMTVFDIPEQVTHEDHGDVYVVGFNLQVLDGRVEHHVDDGYIGGAIGTPFIYFHSSKDASLREATAQELDAFVDGVVDAPHQSDD